VDAQLFLSASDPRPMYQQIVDQITAKVMAGDWAAGQPLPSIRELAAASQVSVITVRRAYEELERAGVIATRQGKGSIVAERGDLPTVLMRESLQQQLDALLAAAARLGMSRAELLRLVEQAPDPLGMPEPLAHATRAVAVDSAMGTGTPSNDAFRPGTTPASTRKFSP
jgi:GntR family transcriptional regulator